MPAMITAEKSSDTQVKIKIQTQSATTDLLVIFRIFHAKLKITIVAFRVKNSHTIVRILIKHKAGVAGAKIVSRRYIQGANQSFAAADARRAANCPKSCMGKTTTLQCKK
jgi:hypothetical protein